MTTTLADGLWQAVQDKPFDAERRLVLADWLEENGDDGEARRQRLYAARLAEALGEAFLTVIQQQLAKANGRRRVRLLTLDDVVCCVRRAQVSEAGWAATGSSTVANAYGYPAQRTVCVAALRSDGGVRVAIALAHATRGSSFVTKPTGGACTKSSSPAKFRDWADKKFPP